MILPLYSIAIEPFLYVNLFIFEKCINFFETNISTYNFTKLICYVIVLKICIHFIFKTRNKFLSKLKRFRFIIFMLFKLSTCIFLKSIDRHFRGLRSDCGTSHSMNNNYAAIDCKMKYSIKIY